MENSVENKKSEELKKKLGSFLGTETLKKEECEGEECFVKQPQDVIERVEKKLITNDGRQLLI